MELGFPKEPDPLFSKEFGLAKYSSVSVLIYGSYATRCMRRLEHIRDQLRLKGIISTKMVCDLPDPKLPKLSVDEINFVKSVNSIDDKTYDYLVFVFYGDCDMSGVAMELMYALLKGYSEKVIVAINLTHIDKISSIIKGAVSRYLDRARIRHFKRPSEAIEELFGLIMGN